MLTSSSTVLILLARRAPTSTCTVQSSEAWKPLNGMCDAAAAVDRFIDGKMVPLAKRAADAYRENAQLADAVTCVVQCSAACVSSVQPTSCLRCAATRAIRGRYRQQRSRGGVAYQQKTSNRMSTDAFSLAAPNTFRTPPSSWAAKTCRAWTRSQRKCERRSSVRCGSA